MSRATILTAIVLACTFGTVAARSATARGSQALRTEVTSTASVAPPAVKLTAAFTPERLGAGTTVHVGFQIDTSARQAPSAVTAVELLYPRELGISSSDLGLETCSPETLEMSGPAGCPTNSVMGSGHAVVEVPFSTNNVLETARVTLISGPVQNGHIAVLFWAHGHLPVLATVVFPSTLLPAEAPFGGALDTQVPLVPSVPNGPDVALTQVQTTLGPEGITYTERVGSKTIRFHPKGILLPSSCPPGGFPFAVHLSFQDGASASAKTAVPCPPSGTSARRRRRR
ncbi:MAG: hypothetical protein ACRDQZ_16250 [Mycobacteriales bacterium]